MKAARIACFAVAALTLLAGATPSLAADKSNPVPPTFIGVHDTGKPDPAAPDPNDPNKGQSGPHLGPAGVPSNDLCTSAIPVAVPSSTAGTTVDATLDGVGTCGTTNTAPGVWYTFTPATTGLYRASTCNQANYDTKISVFSGSCGALGCVGGNDDGPGCAGFSSQLDFVGFAGQPLLVLVHGFLTATGDFTLSLSFLNPLVAGDLCEDAIPVAVPSTTSGTTTGATIDGSHPLCGSNFGANPTAPGLWYEVTGTGNVLEASTCNQAAYDTQLTVYCQDCATPTCIDGNDDGAGCAGFSSLLQWESELGATYRILVHGFSSSSNGAFDLSVTDTGVPSTNPAPCFGPVGACCDPNTAGCTQTDEYLCTVAGGSFAAGLPCFLPTGDVFSYARNPGVLIPDNDPIGVADTVTVPDAFTVLSASVDVDISHTWIGDLRLQLENVATGQIINMWDRRCSSTVNMDITYIDGGLTTLCTDVPLGTGQADPTISGLGPPFSSLGGTPAAGDWRLIVDDNFSGDSGTLNSWTLNLEGGVPVCYAYPPLQEIPTMDRRGLAALALLLAGAAAFLIWRRRG